MRCFALLFFILSSCAELQVYSPASDLQSSQLSDVYFYRPSAFVGSAASPNVYIGDMYVGKLISGRYIEAKVPAGSYKITIGKRKGEYANWSGDNHYFDITLEEEKAYFYKAEFDFSDFSFTIVNGAPLTSGSAKVSLEEVNEETAVDESGDLKVWSERKGRGRFGKLE